MKTASLVQAFKEAVATLDEAQVPEDLRAVAFSRALDHLLGDSTRRVEPTARVDAGGGAASEAVSAPKVAAEGPIGRIASRLGISQKIASRVFDVDEDGVHLLVQRSKFESAKFAATQQVTRLVVAARQAAGLDEGWTPVDQVRSAVEQKGVLDSGNLFEGDQRP